MYRLVLLLPFDVTLLWKVPFATRAEADAKVLALPGGFDVVPDSEVVPALCIEVPFKGNPNED
jgi:hypothetical protein